VYFRIIGLCLLQNEICPLYLNRHVLKYLLGRKIGWHDLAFFDPVMYDGMRQLVHDAETKDFTSMFSALELTFAIDLSQEEVRTPICVIIENVSGKGWRICFFAF